MKFLIPLILLLALKMTHAHGSCSYPWVCESINMNIQYSNVSLGSNYVNADIRAGYLAHQGSFRGNVIFYEGLGDSMLNHLPLFKKLTNAGFRVIGFDYMGQGGSSGTMNNTKVQFIENVGHAIWKRYAINLEKVSRKTVIGWSTGGLAAYLSAIHSTSDQVILLAPGIVPKKLVGGGLSGLPLNEITIETLTSDSYNSSNQDPHLDSIFPNSPLKVPSFATNLLKTAALASYEAVPKSVRGLVLLSGDNDTYVNAEKTKNVLAQKAPHFKVVQYPDALHEIDNERPAIRNKAHQEILNFLLFK